MENNENSGELGNREIITVCIAVSLAVILVASLMPAMIPQGGGDDEPSPYVTSYDINEYNSSITLKYNDTTLAVVNIGEGEGGYSYNINVADGYLNVETFYSNTVRATGESEITFNRDTSPSGTFKYTTPEDFRADTQTSMLWGDVFQADPQLAPTAPEGTPDIYTLIWEAFFLDSPYDPGFDPEYPPGGGSSGKTDSTTAIVMAIIAIIFLGIALTALRTVLPGRGGQR